MRSKYLVGVDGGGTKTIAVAANEDGTVLAVERGDGINYHTIGMERARSNLKEILNRLQARINGECIEVTVGMPALDMPADRELTAAFAGTSFDANLLDLQSDAYITLMGFTLGKPGMIVICGTGSILLMVDKQKRQHVRGGWGYLLGDAGSGYALAIGGLQAAIREWEHVGSKTALSEAAAAHFQLCHPRDLINVIYSPKCTQADIAQFGRIVLKCCENGDEEAIRVTRSNMAAIAANAAEMIACVPEANRVGIWGSVLTNNACARDLFSKELLSRCPQAVIIRPEFPPELGAVIHSMSKKGSLRDEALKNLKESYSKWKA